MSAATTAVEVSLDEADYLGLGHIYVTRRRWSTGDKWVFEAPDFGMSLVRDREIERPSLDEAVAAAEAVLRLMYGYRKAQEKFSKRLDKIKAPAADLW